MGAQMRAACIQGKNFEFIFLFYVDITLIALLELSKPVQK